MQNLCSIPRKNWGMKLNFVQLTSQFSVNRCYHFWWVWPGIPKVLKITSMQCLYNISRMNWVKKLNVLKVFKYESLLHVDTIIFYWFGQTCPTCSGKFAISLWHLKKEVRNEVRELTTLAGSNIAFTIYSTSMFSHHWPFSSFSMASISSLFFIWLIVCVT